MEATTPLLSEPPRFSFPYSEQGRELFLSMPKHAPFIPYNVFLLFTGQKMSVNLPKVWLSSQQSLLSFGGLLE